MRSGILFLLLFIGFAAAGQNNSTLYVYDGLVIKSPEYRKKLDGKEIEKVDVITENIKQYYALPDSVTLIMVTTKSSVNKRLKAFTEQVAQILKQYPFAEFMYEGEALESDSLRIATLGKLKKNHYRINFYPPKNAIKRFGEMGQYSVIEIFPK